MKKITLLLVVLLVALLTSCTTTLAGEAPVKAETKAVENAKSLEFKVTGFSRYGDCYTEASNEELAAIGLEAGDVAIVTLGGKTFEAPLCWSHKDVAEGKPLVKISDKYDASISIRMGDMSKFCGVSEGAKGTITAK